MGKKIVFSSNTSFSLYNFRLPLMRELKNQGFNVVAISPKESPYAELLAKEFEFYPISHLDRKGTNPVKDFLLFLEYLRTYKSLKPNLVINFTIKPNIYSSIACGLLGVPTIGVITGLGYAFIRETWLTRLVRFLYKLAFSFNKFVVFLNREDFITLGRLAKDKSRIIESSGVDTEYFSPDFCQKTENRLFTFLFVGRLLKDKGIYELIEAFRRLRKECEDVRLLIVGDVDEGNPASVDKKDLKSWQEEGLIHWVGFREDVRPFYCEADCVVLPSYREGTPRVLLEAMAMEKPIITTDSVGCRDVCLDGKNGFLVKPRDWESLLRAMRRMVELSEEERKAMGSVGRQMVLEKYDVKVVVDRYLKLIQSVV